MAVLIFEILSPLWELRGNVRWSS